MNTSAIKVTVKKDLSKNLGGISSFQVQFEPQDTVFSLDDFMLAKRRIQPCFIDQDGKGIRTECVRGDHSLWLSTGDGFGLKIILSATEKTIDNLSYLRDCRSDVFPRIAEIAPAVLENYGKERPCVVARMQDVAAKSGLGFGLERLKRAATRVARHVLPFMPGDDPTEHPRLWCPVPVAERCAREFERWKLLPEDEWYKPSNLVSGKIVDCHNFEFLPERYAFPVGNANVEDLEQLYRRSPRADRGTLYQGFKFANGLSFPGYSSDGREFDTYRKLPFLPFEKVKEGRVLDLGSSQGFFSFQAAIHGAAEVVAVERDPTSVEFAGKLNSLCFDFSQISFVKDDIVSYVFDRYRGKADVVFLLSVLHQIYPKLAGAEPFLEKLAATAKFLAFETPVRHSAMPLGVDEVFLKLKKFFRVVRLLYVYKAYSPGWRAIFICYRAREISRP